MTATVLATFSDFNLAINWNLETHRWTRLGSRFTTTTISTSTFSAVIICYIGDIGIARR